MRKTKRTKGRVHLRMNPDLLDALRSYCERNRQPVTWVIEQAVRQLISTK